MSLCAGVVVGVEGELSWSDGEGVVADWLGVDPPFADGALTRDVVDDELTGSLSVGVSVCPSGVWTWRGTTRMCPGGTWTEPGVVSLGSGAVSP